MHGKKQSHKVRAASLRLKKHHDDDVYAMMSGEKRESSDMISVRHCIHGVFVLSRVVESLSSMDFCRIFTNPYDKATFLYSTLLLRAFSP
jgi:hypothetical protein